MCKRVLIGVAIAIKLLSSSVVCAQSGESPRGLLLSEQLSKGAVDTPQLRQAINSDLQRRELLLRAAKKDGVEKNSLVRLHSEMASQDVIIRADLAAWLARHPVSDESVKKAFDTFVSLSGSTEYLVRDILVPTEGDAKTVIARLNTNEKFEVIASQVSQDVNARANGGLQSWAGLGFLDPAIAQALTKLTKGKWTTQPIHAENGWHVIELQDTRPFVAPAYETVKPKIRRDLEQKEVAQYIKSLS